VKQHYEMRGFPRLTAGLLVAALLAGCSGVPNVIDGSEAAQGLRAGGADGLGTDGAGVDGAGGADGSAGGAGPTDAGGSAGGSTGSGGGRAGAGGAGSGSGSGGSGATAATGTVPGSELGNGKGVTDKFINVAFHITAKTCGSTQGAAKEYYDRIDTYVKWFNQHLNYPGGRKLKHSVVDDGGQDPNCQDQARAAGLKISKELNAFAALGVSVNPGADVPIVADTVTRNGTMHIGNNFQTQQTLESRAPYAWSTYVTAESSLTYLTWFVEKRLKGTQYRDDRGVMQPRGFGSLFFEGKEGKDLAAIVKARFDQMGVPIKQYFVSSDQNAAAQQASGLALQMSQDGVNTLVFGVFGQAGVAAATAFDGQQFHPDNLISDYGAFAALAVFNSIYGSQANRFIGVGTPCIVCSRLELSASGGTDEASCPSCSMQENSDAYVKAYKAAGGQAENPQNGAPAYDFWAQLSTLSMGVLGAGPVLNAKTFEHGLFQTEKNRCTVWRFFGRDHPQVGYIDYKPRKHFGGSGFTTLYWVQKQSKFGTPGYFESYDGYQRFDTLAGLPGSASYDTGVRGNYPMTRHQKTGISPEKPC
jgi:hypothetical protein